MAECDEAAADCHEERDEESSGYGVPYCYSDIIRAKTDCLVKESMCFLSMQKPEEAIRRINRALALDIRNPHLYQLRAKALFQCKDYILAIQNLKKAIRLSPDNPQLQEMLAITHGCYADSLYKQELYQEALGHYNLVYDVLPQYLIKCISCHVHLKNYQPAMALLESKLTDDAPDRVNLLVMRAKLHLLFGNATKCFHDIQAALELDASSIEAKKLKIELERRTGQAHKQAIHYCLTDRRKEALLKMDIAIDSDPYNAKHHILRGALQRQMHSYNEAVDDFLAAMNKIGHSYENPIYQEASKQLVLTFNDFAVNCFKNGFYCDAVTLLNKAIKEDKGEPGLYINRGDCFYKQNQYQFAAADYQVAYDLSKSRTTGLHYRLAVVHYTLGMMDFVNKLFPSAEDHFTAALFHSPHTARFYMCRARTRKERNRLPEAQEDIILSLLLHPNEMDCLPLISQLFPGCSVHDLISSSYAKKLKGILYAARESTAPAESTTTLNRSDAYITKLLHGLTVFTSSDDNDAVTTHQSLRVITVSKDRKNSCAWTMIDKAFLKLMKCTDSSFVQHCMEESDFHALILYTKKKCTNEVHKILYGTPNFPEPLPKIIFDHKDT